MFLLRYSQSFSPNFTIVCEKSPTEPKWSSGHYENVTSLPHPVGMAVSLSNADRQLSLSVLYAPVDRTGTSRDAIFPDFSGIPDFH